MTNVQPQRDISEFYNRKITALSQILKDVIYTQRLYNNVYGTEIHDVQVEFAYLVDSIQRGYVYEIPHNLTRLDRLVKSFKESYEVQK
jgi:hypothetical protein